MNLFIIPASGTAFVQSLQQYSIPLTAVFQLLTADFDCLPQSLQIRAVLWDAMHV